MAFVSGRHRPRILLLLAMVLFAFIMGNAASNPLYRLIVHIPILNAFRCSARWLLIISGCLSLLAAWMLTELGEGKRWLQVALAGILACEVMLFAIRYNLVMPAERLQPPADWAALTYDRGRVASALPSVPPPGERTQYELARRLLAPNLNLLWYMPVMDGYMPLQLRDFERLRPADPEKSPQRCAVLGASKLLAASDGPRPAEGWVALGQRDGLNLYSNRYYRGLCWLEKPSGHGIGYSHYSGRGAYANGDFGGPNRLVFSVVRGPWLTAEIGSRAVPLEDCGGGLCAVSVGPDTGLVSLHYHHPRLREGLIATTVSFVLFCAYMLLISYFRRRPRHAIIEA
jgi:hypothetical protein